MRQAQALERAPRASSAEIAIRAAGLRSLNDVLGPHIEKMKREDFCDVVAKAIRLGNLSEDAASMAMNLREWVRSDGDRRMPFPEWLAGEGGKRMSLLTQQWVRWALGEGTATAKRTTFHEWLLAGAPTAAPK